MTQILIILILTSFSLIGINYNVLLGLLEKNKAINQYKINHFIWSHCLFIMPMPILMGSFYFVWFYNINLIIDLSFLGVILFLYDLVPFKDSLWFVYFLFFVVFFNIIILFILLLVSIYKYYLRNCFKLFIYYYQCPSAENESRDFWYLFLSENFKVFIDKLPWFQLGYTNLVAESIYIISCKLMVFLYGKNYRLQVSENHPHNVISDLLRSKDNGHTLLLMSPLFFIFYDCIFHNFVITHVFYYLILFIPIVLFRGFTTFMLEHLNYLCQALWRIYYSEKKLLFAILPEVNPLLEYYLTSGLKRNIDIGLEVDFDLYYQMLFFPFRDNIFHNNDYSVYIILTGDDKVYEAIFGKDDRVSLGREWILLAYNEGNEKT